MRPLIPRVRPGDILKGTRNLRNYLQTTATLNLLQELSAENLNPQGTDYHPTKDEGFLVTANAWDTFGVVGLDSGVTLLFINPATPSVQKLRGLPEPRMNPTMFSQWFIRTSEKKVDLSEWSDFAHYMWASFHLNLNNSPRKGMSRWAFQPGYPGIFLYSTWDHDLSKRILSEAILYATVRGSTRPRANPSSATRHSRGVHSSGFGPRLEEIPGMRSEIRGLCHNPRVTQRLMKEGNSAHKVLTLNL